MGTFKGVDVAIAPPQDVLVTLREAPQVQTVILDPWYNRGVGGYRDDYDDWLSEVVAASAKVAQHIFVWGFPDVLAHQVSRIPEGFRLVQWLTWWYYKNHLSIVKGWRPWLVACLHLAREDADLYAQNFVTEEQTSRWQDGDVRLMSWPPSVLPTPRNDGYTDTPGQQGHTVVKPHSVFRALVLMSTKEGDTVLDPMCGSGTTGAVCIELNRNAILCDTDPVWINVAANYVQQAMNDTHHSRLIVPLPYHSE